MTRADRSDVLGRDVPPQWEAFAARLPVWSTTAAAAPSWTPPPAAGWSAPAFGTAAPFPARSIPAPAPAVPSAPLPLRAGMTVVGGFAAILVLGAAVLHVARSRFPLAATLGAVGSQYAVMLGLCLYVSHRWGSGSMRRDLGITARRRDLFDGALGWLAGMGLIALVGSVLRMVGVPIASNNPLSGAGRHAVSVPQWAAIGLAGMIMVVIAPFFEELLFRGVLLRALAGRLPVPIAIAIQAVVFGGFHFDPRRGWGNVGLLAVLSVIGAVLGTIAHRSEGRLGGSIVAHMLHNSLAFAVGIAALL